MSLQLKERIEKALKGEPCAPCEKDKQRLKKRSDLIGGVARRVWPDAPAVEEGTDG